MDAQHSLSTRLYKALQLVFELHGRDARKACQVPAMAHLLSVCALVQMDGGDEDEAIAALLHDALEDKADIITREDIRRLFGEKVLVIVEISTDTDAEYRGGLKSGWHDRKRFYLESVKHAGPELLRVTVADKIDNARAILADHRRVGDAVWKRFNASREEILWYYTEAEKAYRHAGVNSALLDDLAVLVGQMKKIVEGGDLKGGNNEG